MQFIFELVFDEDQLTTSNKLELKGVLDANAAAIGAALGASLVTEINSTLSFGPTMPTLTRSTMSYDLNTLASPTQSGNTAQTFTPSRDR